MIICLFYRAMSYLILQLRFLSTFEVHTQVVSLLSSFIPSLYSLCHTLAMPFHLYHKQMPSAEMVLFLP